MWKCDSLCSSLPLRLVDHQGLRFLSQWAIGQSTPTDVQWELSAAVHCGSSHSSPGRASDPLYQVVGWGSANWWVQILEAAWPEDKLCAPPLHRIHSGTENWSCATQVIPSHVHRRTKGQWPEAEGSTGK